MKIKIKAQDALNIVLREAAKKSKTFTNHGHRCISDVLQEIDLPDDSFLILEGEEVKPWPQHGDIYFVPSFVATDMYIANHWFDTDNDKKLLSANLIFKTASEAKEMTQKLLSTPNAHN